MNIKLSILSLLLAGVSAAQSVSGVYKIGDLLRRISRPDTAYVVNFWATWCKPCIQELPAFDSLYTGTRNQPVKIILVSLDFKEDLDKKVNPFLKKNNIRVECVLLDEVNGNDFINKISPQWSGAIPGTLFSCNGKKIFIEKKATLQELEGNIKVLTH
jgi:thiol-disulfide isomerase/thioredoxin